MSVSRRIGPVVTPSLLAVIRGPYWVAVGDGASSTVRRRPQVTSHSASRNSPMKVNEDTSAHEPRQKDRGDAVDYIPEAGHGQQDTQNPRNILRFDMSGSRR